MDTAQTDEVLPAASRYLPAWNRDDLPAPPLLGWRGLVTLVGPGVVLAGTSIGSGEWLFGPAVSAQYGATLLWLALLSIVLQMFFNLVVMRYAIYCGEPVIVGILRTRPGPRFWIVLFLILEFASIWPYSASNAAVPLAAAFLGRLPQTAGDQLLVKVLGFTIFVAAFVPLIFGGTIYRMLERIMSIKLVIVLTYLTFVAAFLVSATVVWDVAAGFFRFGQVPLRPDTLIVGRHFQISTSDDGRHIRLRGSWDLNGEPIGDVIVSGREAARFTLAELGTVPETDREMVTGLLEQTQEYAASGGFFLETADGDVTLSASGEVIDHHTWKPLEMTVTDANGTRVYTALEEVPEPYQSRFREYFEHEGLELVGIVGYVREHGQLPPLDWAMVVAFIAIAGAGGLTNTMFSNYARDKGWGMGRHVGAIPSALGARTITLSHTGCIFPLNDSNRSRWRGWMRHIALDQSIWIIASVIGMALPCMMSLEFIRNASVTGDRVAAMTAEGIAERYPAHASVFWFLTLFVGFLVLAPGQISISDQVTRRWTDILWTSSKRIRKLGGGEVRLVYYTLLAIYGVCGLVILSLFPALQIAKIAAVLQNIALGCGALMTIHVHRTLVPRSLRPGWVLQLGTLVCGVFFLAIGICVVMML